MRQPFSMKQQPTLQSSSSPKYKSWPSPHNYPLAPARSPLIVSTIAIEDYSYCSSHDCHDLTCRTCPSDCSIECFGFFDCVVGKWQGGPFWSRSIGLSERQRGEVIDH